MSEQPLNLRQTYRIVRRHRILVGVLTLVGLLVGAAYATLNPPKLSAQALVVLPQTGVNVPTQVVIAGSDPVLAGALGKVGGLPLDQLSADVHASSLTSNVIQITGRARSGAQAEDIANAVANSYLAYVSAATSPVGHVPARLLQPATEATGLSPVEELLLTGAYGLGGGLIVGVIAALARGRNDRRLRSRDEIANSIGIPVLASLPVEHPSDAPGWRRLLTEYEPAVVHGWRLRVALDYLGVTPDGEPMSLTVLSLSADRAALALGPQLAVYAASQGIGVALVVGPQQDENATAALRTACAAPLPDGHLRVFAPDDGRSLDARDVALIVTVAVVDGRAPQIPAAMRTRTTLLGVTAAAATAEQLASVATAAAKDRRPVGGILVADPDADDQTTGRIPQLTRSARRVQPNRLRHTPTEIRR
jgi:capsular polysaccharide biosynthesis protein